MGRPLDGIRVIAFTQVVAGPFGTVALSDMGAEVIKVENVPETDAPGTDNLEGIQVTPQIAHFWAYNRGTHGICLNMRTQAAKEWKNVVGPPNGQTVPGRRGCCVE